MAESVIIIGSGLGGLECGYILARNGCHVTILEKNAQPGGCLQTFRRLGRVFDSGFHYVGGLEKGQSLYTIFNYLGLLDLPWQKMSEDCSDKIFIGEEEFSLPIGYENFVKVLSERFPHQRENLERYTSVLKSVGDNIFNVFNTSPDVASNPLFSKSAYDFLEETISDPQLRKVLSGASLKMHLDQKTLPLYVFAQINSSYIQSSWRLKGGGQAIVDSLVRSIESMGGDVLCDSEVTDLEETDGKISRIILSDGRALSADWVISNAHPSVSLGLVRESSKIRNVYRRRIASLPNSFGMYTANICLKKGCIRYQNNNLFVHSQDADLWNPNLQGTDSAMVHFYVPEDGGVYADRIDIISPMSYSQVEAWQNLPVGRRGKAYENLKREKLQQCLDLVADKIEGLEDAIEAVFTSTPLTYADYTNSPHGSSYGIMKDYNSPLTSFISPRTPISNFLLTGQSLNLHGILGVSMTSFLTCSCILGLETLKMAMLAE